jgi:hypothetical protein
VLRASIKQAKKDAKARKQEAKKAANNHGKTGPAQRAEVETMIMEDLVAPEPETFEPIRSEPIEFAEIEE